MRDLSKYSRGRAGNRKNLISLARRLLLALGLWVILLSSVYGQPSPSATEYQIKAAFLFNFVKFVEWPSDSFPSEAAPLQICVLGQNPLGQELENLTRGKTVSGRALEINHVSSLQRAKTCQLLFVSSSERRRTQEILAAMEEASVLTVGDEEGFARAGGVINFVFENDRVRFEINVDAATRARLKISAKLLALAKLVVRTGAAGGN
jgi:hypothetical protein